MKPIPWLALGAIALGSSLPVLALNLEPGAFRKSSTSPFQVVHQEQGEPSLLSERALRCRSWSLRHAASTRRPTGASDSGSIGLG